MLAFKTIREVVVNSHLRIQPSKIVRDSVSTAPIAFKSRYTTKLQSRVNSKGELSRVKSHLGEGNTRKLLPLQHGLLPGVAHFLPLQDAGSRHGWYPHTVSHEEHHILGDILVQCALTIQGVLQGLPSLVIPKCGI